VLGGLCACCWVSPLKNLRNCPAHQGLIVSILRTHPHQESKRARFLPPATTQQSQPLYDSSSSLPPASAMEEQQHTAAARRMATLASHLTPNASQVSASLTSTRFHLPSRCDGLGGSVGRRRCPRITPYCSLRLPILCSEFTGVLLVYFLFS
jgi:hypothetical protein